MQKPSIPKGTRDFSPEEMAKRNYIFDTIKEVYRLHGFQQIETPAMENLSTLLGKYGEEGDRLLFKVLNSGNFLSGLNSDDLAEGNSAKSAHKISREGHGEVIPQPFVRYFMGALRRVAFGKVFGV